jgi:hypothetical protein
MWGVDYEKPMRSDISTVVLSDLQAESGMAPATEENEKEKCSKAAFLSCLCSEKKVGWQFSLVIMSWPSLRT